MHLLATELEHPCQPMKLELVPGVATNVNFMPDGKLFEHVAPHLIPDGMLATLPPPVPLLLTLIAYKVLAEANIGSNTRPINKTKAGIKKTCERD
jgi:hypothetical protein